MASHHEEEQLGKLYDAATARRLIRYLTPYKRLVIIALLLTLVVNLVRQAGPLLTKWAIDDFIRPAALQQINLDKAFNGIAVLAGLYLLTNVITLGIGYLQDLLLNTIGQRVMFDLREEIFRKFQTIEVAYYDQNPVGRLITRLTNDVDALNELFTSGLVEVLGDLVLIAGALGMMLYYSWSLSLVSLAVVPLLVIATAWFQRGSRKGFRAVRAKIARLNAFTQEHDLALLERYFQASPGLICLRAFEAMKCASMLREGLWSAVSHSTSTIRLDYAGYTRTWLERLDVSWREYVG